MIVENKRSCDLNSFASELEILGDNGENEGFLINIGSPVCQAEPVVVDKECRTDLTITQILQLEESNRSLFAELRRVKNKLLVSDLSKSGFEGTMRKPNSTLAFQHL